MGDRVPRAEAKRIQKELIAKPQLQWIRVCCNRDKGKELGSIISYVYQIVEYKLLTIVKDFFESKGYKVTAPVFD